jgi:hypothetical protein
MRYALEDLRLTGLVLIMLVLEGGPVRAQHTVRAQGSLPQSLALARVPFRELPEGWREKVEYVAKDPTLYARGPAEAFAGQPLLYDWLLDHPDRGVAAWRRLGARCADITDSGSGMFVWKDGHGSEVRWQTLYRSKVLRVWFAEGHVRPGPLLPAVPVELVVLLRYGNRPDSPGRTLLYHQSDLFLRVDSKTAALITQLLGTSAPRLAEQCLGQLETFFSGLVWYLDQHPERTRTLLAANQQSAASGQRSAVSGQ